MSDNPSLTPGDGGLPAQPLNEKDSTALISGAACTAEFLAANAHLVRSVETSADLRLASDRTPWEHLKSRAQGMLFVWHPLDGGEPRYQFRSDAPADGEGKYQFEPAPRNANHGVIREGSDEGAVALVEGFKKGLAVASTLAESGDTDTWVIALPGCSAWSTGDWTPDISLVRLAEDRAVVICMDADASTNLAVYTGAERLGSALSNSESVRYVQVPGGGKTGVDDYLTALPVEKRAAAWRRLVDKATSRPAQRRPYKKTDSAPKKSVAQQQAELTELVGQAYEFVSGRVKLPPRLDGSQWLREGGGLDADLLVRAVAESDIAPIALTADGRVAVYRQGVYDTSESGFPALVSTLLGAHFTTGHLANATAKAQAMLHSAGLRLPDLAPDQMLNVKNGMLDLKTLVLHPHDPKYLSIRQIPVAWNPDATSPTYEDWLDDRVGPHQSAVVEEVISQFLDPSRTPTRALFLFGPSRSGKSTMLRLAEKLVGGHESVSGLSLQDISDNQFAAAELYGRAINMCPDLPKGHVNDLSVFKRVTGDDPITANRKYGKMFHFRANALFLFSTNTIPTISVDDGDAYFQRTVPAVFPKSYKNKENPEIETALGAELPGILVRWAEARQRHILSGHRWQAVHPAVRNRFESASDRVAQFVGQCCEIGVRPMAKAVGGSGSLGIRRERGVGMSVEDSWLVGEPLPIKRLFKAFDTFRTGEGQSGGMNLKTFRSRIETLPGVRETWNIAGARVLNIAVKPQEEWGASADTYAALIPLLFPPDNTDGDGDDPDALYNVTPIRADVAPPTTAPAPKPAKERIVHRAKRDSAVGQLLLALGPKATVRPENLDALMARAMSEAELRGERAARDLRVQAARMLADLDARQETS
ncbi:phage/plasmid primase, P4 family [Mycobacteroides abscessus]|uniref:phage/plasmid primase, P4 family n=1 Tax=Mycobacteroides abscessus TaxID=36809 RepID=UPI00092A03E5|nr:phage/plasmid primase, P4 family [Mycobacteroides abscessus]SHO82503.1 bacteriophage protein [Mycobacteroides abscessus subsp. abscessus]SHP25418.1 bacteriophage protein [Mycobacteroides abscessus subsp. abscessus]SHP72496.1 bacteriophage protein [Mycobacteroides abscessus subsp. abscessus]SHQ91993.1 bacteriophage protein [Mycobacteroides abscessus subsp. abscessus]SHR00377.1 bacteriophage protein [Mycobacteroides abscessus subsp. abscessus]